MLLGSRSNFPAEAKDWEIYFFQDHQGMGCLGAGK